MGWDVSVNSERLAGGLYRRQFSFSPPTLPVGRSIVPDRRCDRSSNVVPPEPRTLTPVPAVQVLTSPTIDWTPRSPSKPVVLHTLFKPTHAPTTDRECRQAHAAGRSRTRMTKAGITSESKSWVKSIYPSDKKRNKRTSVQNFIPRRCRMYRSSRRRCGWSAWTVVQPQRQLVTFPHGAKPHTGPTIAAIIIARE